MDILDKAIASSRSKKLNEKVEKVLALDKKYSNMSDDELKQKSNELFERAKKGESESKLMTEAFALVREATWRVLGMKQYPVQIKGGISIAEGNLAEMATGEGKTIVVPLVAYLHALSGENVHVVTSNDYLAKRDSEQMSKLFGFLGMSVGLSAPQMDVEQKKQAYACNITYTTATELGFDYLRDNHATSDDAKVLRGLNKIIIDEADNALLDEASTPLILSNQEKADPYEVALLQQITKIMENVLVEDIDYEVDRERNIVSLSEEGITKLEKAFKVENLFSENCYDLLNYCNCILQAHTLFEKDVNYVVKDGKVQIVGDTTGRILDGRTYSHGIQQAIEAKERVAISPYTKTVSNINFQNFFKLYDKVGGMSGTCKTDEEELEKIYGLRVDKIETNKPLRRVDDHFRFYHTLEAKNEQLKKRIAELHNSGRPILLGTSSVENSVELAKLLDEMGLEYNLLNAKNDEEESKIIAQAGKRGAITIATNMAGRGTDIKLGGNPTFMAQEKMEELGFSPELISFADSYLAPKTDKEIEARDTFNKLKSDFKKQTDKEKIEVMKLGGLAVIGTTLNTSCRVDNQLRGRAGRQGEPGSSEIYVAWDDVRDTFLIGDETEDNYLNLLAKRKVDPRKEITDKNVVAFIEKIQRVSEGQFKKARETNYNLNSPENLQRIALYDEKEDIIKIFDNFNPDKVVLGEISTEFEQFMLKLYQDDIARIVDDYTHGKKTDDDFSDTEDLTDDDFKKSGDYLRKNMAKYCLNTSLITDKFLQTNDPKIIKEKLSDYAFSIFQRAICETKDTYKDLSSFLKRQILSEYDNAWSSHLERLEQAKFQLGISQQTNESAIHYFCKDSFNFYLLLKDKVRENVIKSTSQLLCKCVLTTRALNEDKAKKATQETQQNSQQQNQEQK